LPFLRIADTGSEQAVIHCWGGNGRTGHVLAAWLAAARGLSSMEAIEAVEATGRLPREAVLAGNATLDELIELLASYDPQCATTPRRRIHRRLAGECDTGPDVPSVSLCERHNSSAVP
jgi:hypothetical protein